jgi:hypothetical protein
MEKKIMSRNQASKSVPEDSLGKTPKSNQKPEPAHVGAFTSTSQVDESLGGKAKKKAEAAHVGPRSVSEPDETITKRNLETGRK